MRQSGDPATQGQRDYLPREWGWAVLCGIVACCACWLAFQRQQLTAAPAKRQPMTWTDARFDAQAGYLPTDALLGFVEIPAGPFTMGSDPTVDNQAFANERWSAQSYQGRVELPAFYIGRYEVTVAQFAAFAAASGYRVEPLALQSPPDYPVAHVTWTDALAYGGWLTDQLRQWPQTPADLKQRLSAGWQITLPSEAQWEKAARGSQARIYPWGNAFDRRYANLQGTGPKPVGGVSCPFCAYGLSDMSGNVWELTRSAYRAYPYAEALPDLNADALWVMRGGSFNDGPGNGRAAVRGGIDPGVRRDFIGFRLVLTPPEGSPIGADSRRQGALQIVVASTAGL
jgi:formylglycine-generating enzyme required for sulfatase activity